MNTLHNNSQSCFAVQEKSNSSHNHDRINACLSKAEALTAVAATIDFEVYTAEIINNYLWTLLELIQEARGLYNKNKSIN
jgi:hypothetical protein